ncbi:MAG: hypothetical protein RMJ59_06405 [Candidatus Nitrosocaldus sp.]|nr:hypothetical protein [Candidatus Nitrosocaldus sp.]MDW8275991.1 hypothetical protein [Candidatus Nitrosocaldus sp.]
MGGVCMMVEMGAAGGVAALLSSLAIGGSGKGCAASYSLYEHMITSMYGYHSYHATLHGEGWRCP